MFDERHLQLTSAYARASQYFIKTVLYPLADFVYESIEQAIDLKCKIELGKETYVLTPDENGGWKWSKFSTETQESVTAEFEHIEELLQELLLPLLPPGDATPLLPGSTTPPDLPPNDFPPVLPIPNLPSYIPPTATPVELITISPQLTPPSESTFSNLPTTSTSTPASSSSPNSFVSTSNLDPHHWQELVQGSAISPSIAQLNFESLHIDPIEQEHQAWEYLMYSDKLERVNTGRLTVGMLHKYSHIEAGGWWCNSGVDPRSFANLQPGDKPDAKLWGCYKPNQPRNSLDKTGKVIKYEHPPKTELSIFLLDVPDDIADKIYNKAGVDPSDCDRQSGFWYCIWKYNVQVTITEGAKKAASILSQGEAAIGLPGIYAGYRSLDQLGNPITPTIHDELAVFATPEREIKICFDYETRLKTKRHIDIATYRTGQLLEERQAKVSVVTLPGPDKGVDDLIVAQGPEAFEKLSAQALPLETWHKNHQPPDLRLTLTFKDGTVKTIYEQIGDGTVALTLDNLPEQTIDGFKKPRSELPTDIVPREQAIDAEAIDAETIEAETIEAEAIEAEAIDAEAIDAEVLADEKAVVSHQKSLVPIQFVKPIQFWSLKEDVTLYQPNFFRKRLESRENKQIASAAYVLVKKYGIEQKDTALHQALDGRVYHADAFVIKNNGDKYSIHRRHDEQELMTFQADQWGNVGNIKVSQNPKSKNKQINILPIERQEFLLVADYLQSGKQLPRVDEDPRKIATTLASLSPDGTHNLLESFKQAEVLKILTHTLTTFERDDLNLGNYRVLYQKSHSDNTYVLRLFKTEHNGVTREAVRFDFHRTETGITHQVKTMAITEADLNKFRLLAQKLDIHKTLATMAGNPTATRNIDLPLHPQISKQWQNLENREQAQNFSTPSTQPVSTTQSPTKQRVEQSTKQESDFPYPQNQSSNSQFDNFALPLHPKLAQFWQQLEQDNTWASVAKHGHSELQQKIQQTLKLTISEQRELYQRIQIQAWSEIQQHGHTNLVLPPLADIIRDLRSQLHQQPQTHYSDPIRNTQLPLHREIATHWHDLEANHSWSSVADQYNYPLREKLRKTGKLTIGEQRELYQKILLQSQVERHHHGKTNISLPPLSEILQDLIDARSQIIEHTYTPQVEVHSQPSHAPHQPSSSSVVEF